MAWADPLHSPEAPIYRLLHSPLLEKVSGADDRVMDGSCLSADNAAASVRAACVGDLGLALRREELGSQRQQ